MDMGEFCYPLTESIKVPLVYPNPSVKPQLLLNLL